MQKVLQGETSSHISLMSSLSAGIGIQGLLQHLAGLGNCTNHSHFYLFTWRMLKEWSPYEPKMDTVNVPYSYERINRDSHFPLDLTYLSVAVGSLCGENWWESHTTEENTRNRDSFTTYPRTLSYKLVPQMSPSHQLGDSGQSVPTGWETLSDVNEQDDSLIWTFNFVKIIFKT